MATREAKTKPSGVDLDAFVDKIEPARRRDETRALDTLFRKTTGFDPLLWGGSMLGYGRYKYIYESGHSGESLACGFAPRKANLVFYIMPGYADFADLLADLGPHKLGKACLYVRRLELVDTTILARLITAGLEDLGTRWTIEPT